MTVVYQHEHLQPASGDMWLQYILFHSNTINKVRDISVTYFQLNW